MCDFFSCIVTKDAAVLFTEVNSHDEVILRSGVKNDTKDFVRIENTEENRYRLDGKTILKWYGRIAALAEQRVEAIYRMLQPLWSEYDKIEQPALSEYKRDIDVVQGYTESLEVGL